MHEWVSNAQVVTVPAVNVCCQGSLSDAGLNAPLSLFPLGQLGRKSFLVNIKGRVGCGDHLEITGLNCKASELALSCCQFIAPFCFEDSDDRDIG